MCIAAPSISYTSYFNNTHTYTNSTTALTNSANRGVFTNGIITGENGSASALLSVLFPVPQGDTNRYAIRQIPSIITDAGGTYTDDLLQIGLNPQGTAGLWQSYIQLESKFRVNGASPFKSELHWQWLSPDALTTRRPISATVTHGTFASEVTLSGLTTLASSDGSTHIVKAEDGQLQLSGGSMSIRFSTNNSTVMSMLNAAGGAYLNFPYYNSSNQFLVPSTIIGVGNLINFTNSNVTLTSGNSIRWENTNAITVTGGTMEINAPTTINLRDVPYVYNNTATWYKPAGPTFVSTTAASNVDAGATDLISRTIPAATFVQNTDAMTIRCSGIFAANGNSKQVTAVFGATTVFDSGSLAFNGGAWTLDIYIIRTGTASQKAFATWTSTSTLLPATVTRTLPAATMSGTIVFKCTGTGAASNDITQEILSMRFEPGFY